MLKMGKWCLTFSQRHKGSLLLEVLMGFVIVSIGVMVFSTKAVQLFHAWQRMETDVELLDAGRYMLTKLERELSISTVDIRIVGNTKLEIKTEYGHRDLEIYTTPMLLVPKIYDLYLRTTTEEGSGVNPLFIRDCGVQNVSFERISDKEIFVKFDLVKQERRKTFERLFYCVNGVVHHES